MATIPGSAYPDFITGTSLDDYVAAGAGNDSRAVPVTTI